LVDEYRNTIILPKFFQKIKEFSWYFNYLDRQNTYKGVMNMKKAIFFIVLALLTSNVALAAPPEYTEDEEVIQAYVQQCIEISN